MDLYRSNGVPHAYSDMAEEVQRGRDAKIAHLLKQVHLPNSGFFLPKTEYAEGGDKLLKRNKLLKARGFWYLFSMRS